MEDEPEQSAQFDIEGPDEDGCVWIRDPGADMWRINLGPRDAVALKLCEWLCANGYGEME